MRGLILAAGRGSRLHPLTADRPKCLVELQGCSLLSRQLAALHAGGVADVAVVAGWCADRVAATGLRTFLNRNWSVSTMVHSLACAGEWLRAGETVVAYGDIVFAPQDVRRLATTSGPLVVAYDERWLGQWSRRFDDPLSDAETFQLGPAGVLRGIGDRPSTVDEVQGQYLGLLKFDPGGWDVVEQDLAQQTRRPDSTGGDAVRQDMTATLGRIVASGTTVRTVPVRGPWHEFDSIHDTEVGREVLAELDALLFPPQGPASEGTWT